MGWLLHINFYSCSSFRSRFSQPIFFVSSVVSFSLFHDEISFSVDKYTNIYIYICLYNYVYMYISKLSGRYNDDKKQKGYLRVLCCGTIIFLFHIYCVLYTEMNLMQIVS